MQQLFFSLLLAVSVGTNTPERPNVEGWTVMPQKQKQLEPRPGDYLRALIGRGVQYQNPEDPNEFVLVLYRHIALVSERPKESDRNQGSDSGRPVLVDVASSHHSSKEREAVERVQKATDAFAYVHWRIGIDKRTGQEMILGQVESWLLGPNGLWAYDIRLELGAIKDSPFSESASANSELRLVVGIKYTLGDTTHIIRVDQADLVAPKKGEKNAK